MTEITEQIWEVFCGELIDNGVKDDEDVRQALATALRVLADELSYTMFLPGNDCRVIDASAVYKIADKLEELK